MRIRSASTVARNPPSDPSYAGRPWSMSHGAAAEVFDVAQVVGGQQDRGALFGVEVGQEAAYGRLADDVEADRGFVRALLGAWAAVRQMVCL
jgi:hypothetical protein